MASSREPRKRLVPFLYNMIGHCPDVVWENREEGMFRVPWRHFNNRDWIPDDSKIFLEWAKHTGKYNESDKTDYPTWKTRFRCALNKIPEIREVKKLHKTNIAKPYRVYQFVNTPSNFFSPINDYTSDSSSSVASPATPASSTASNQSPQMPTEGTDYLETASPQPLNNFSQHQHQYLQQPISPQTTVQIPTVVEEAAQDGNLGHYFHNIAPSNSDNTYVQNSTFLEMSANGEMFVQNVQQPQIPHGVQEGVQMYNVRFETQTPIESVVSELTHFPMSNFPSTDESMDTNQSLTRSLKSVETNDLVPMQSGEIMPSMSSLNTPNSSLGSYVLPPMEVKKQNLADENNPQPVFSFTLWYGFNQRCMVKEGTITTQGCHFYADPCNQKSKVSLPTPDLLAHVREQIEMPFSSHDYNGERLDETQNTLLKQLLDNMFRGITFTVKDDAIYAQRLCKTRIFVSDKKTQSTLLERGGLEPVQIFDAKKSIEPHVYLTFGQEIKKDDKPMRRILICLKIEHIKARERMNTSLEMQSTSNSLEPLISGNDGDDTYLAQQLNRLNVR